MPRSLSAELAAHIERVGKSDLALCAAISRTSDDFTTYPRFTSWDRDLTITEDGGDEPLDVVYLTAPGMSVSQIQANANGGVDHLEIRILPTVGVVEDDILAGKWNGAGIRLFLVNPSDLTQGTLELMSGQLGQVTLDGGAIVGEFLGLLQHYQATIGEIVTSTCQNEFCGEVDSRGRGCGLDIADFTEAGEVTGWDGDGLVVDSVDFTGFPDNEFNDGILTFDDEPWISFGVRFFIQADGIIALKSAPPFPVTAAMTFTRAVPRVP
jgi:uncharacterized phage protein (TIGR02218 family)